MTMLEAPEFISKYSVLTCDKSKFAVEAPVFINIEMGTALVRNRSAFVFKLEINGSFPSIDWTKFKLASPKLSSFFISGFFAA